MYKYLNWLSIFIVLLLMIAFAVCRFDLYQNSSVRMKVNIEQSRNVYESKTDARVLNDLLTRDTYGSTEVYPITLLVIFGVMGFSVNLFFRVIYLYCEWREGNDINWGWQAFLTFVVPAAYIVALLEIVALGSSFNSGSN